MPKTAEEWILELQHYQSSTPSGTTEFSSEPPHPTAITAEVLEAAQTRANEASLSDSFERLVKTIAEKQGIDLSQYVGQEYRGKVEFSDDPPKPKDGGVSNELYQPDFYDCKLCKNRGYVIIIDDTGQHTQRCKCQRIRASKWRLKKSGLSDSVGRMTFDNFVQDTPDRAEMYRRVDNYTKGLFKGPCWLFIGGNRGSGKTHLCTAVCNWLIEKGKDVRYMTWRDDAPAAKRRVNDPSYEDLVNPWKQCQILYIDDFFKVDKQRGESPTAGDVNLAYEIINSRYNNSKLITIISSEFTLPEIIDIDSAVAGRIMERCKGNVVNISSVSDWRLTQNAH